MGKEEMEKYSAWYKINNLIAGPFLVVSILYALAYIFLIMLAISSAEIFESFLIYYYIGFPLFLVSSYAAFTGILLRGIR